ncbi:MAG: hypothetical protein J0M01_08015 [Dechloromonas sp.]|nr:hypothetical protein [Dechloromonas sp.]
MNTDLFDQFDALVHLIYEALARPELWPLVVDQIRAALKGSAGLLFTPLLPVSEGGFAIASQLSSETLFRHASHYAALDVWTQAGIEQELFTPGEIVTDEDLLPRAQFLESAYYLEFLKPANISRLCTMVLFAQDQAGRPVTVLSLYGPVNAPPFDQAARQLLTQLQPHLSRALKLRHQLRGAENAAASSLQAIDKLPMSLLFFGVGQNVLHANRHALDFLQSSATLSLSCPPGVGCRLETRTSRAGVALKHLLDTALPQPYKHPNSISLCMPIPEYSGNAPIMLSILPISSQADWPNPLREIVAIGFLTTNAPSVAIDSQILKALYRLSPAEIRVVEGLCADQTLTEIASNFQLSVQTVRDQLKSIFSKTGTRRQSQLVRLLTTLSSQSPMP